MQFRAEARPSPIAGTWYAGEPGRLASQVDAYISDAVLAEDEYPGRVVGLLAPHAGHRYSGRTAGYAYKMVADAPRPLVVLLSPFHRFGPGQLLTTVYSAYRTPLGEITVAQEPLRQLDEELRANGLALEQVAKEEEHSLEIQLPFLQRAWKAEFSLLPIMLRTLDGATLQTLANALHNVVKHEDFLVIASTDLSHFYPLDLAEALDAEMMRRVKNYSPEQVLSAEQEGSASACGAGAVAAMLWMAAHAGADRVHILNYSTSADTTGDASSVVGYAAAAVMRSAP